MLEFNPFYGDISSGASLFDWKRDRELIYNNKGITLFKNEFCYFIILCLLIILLLTLLDKAVIRIRANPSAGSYERKRPVVVDYI